MLHNERRFLRVDEEEWVLLRIKTQEGVRQTSWLISSVNAESFGVIRKAICNPSFDQGHTICGVCNRCNTLSQRHSWPWRRHIFVYRELVLVPKCFST